LEIKSRALLQTRICEYRLGGVAMLKFVLVKTNRKRPLCCATRVGTSISAMLDQGCRNVLMENIQAIHAGFEAIETRINAAEVKLGEADSKFAHIEDELAFLDGRITATKIEINASR